VSAAENFSPNFGSMTDHPTGTVFTNWGEGLNCAFKTIEDMPRTGRYYFEALVVFVSADFAFCHGISS
jgi:hypothetical protein